MNETLIKSIKAAPADLKRRWGRGMHSGTDIWWYVTVCGTDVWLRRDGQNRLTTVEAGFKFHAVQVPYQGMERGAVDYLLDRGAIVSTSPLSWAREFELPETVEAVEVLMRRFEAIEDTKTHFKAEYER